MTLNVFTFNISVPLVTTLLAIKLFLREDELSNLKIVSFGKEMMLASADLFVEGLAVEFPVSPRRFRTVAETLRDRAGFD